MNKYYVTTPIYYVNDRPHIGHVYTTTIADIFARYHRLKGEDVFFLTGTDEHAAKVVDSAAQRNLSAQEWADQNAQAFQDTFRRLELSHDDFIRTSQPRHTEKVQRYVAALIESGAVYLGDYEGWYDAGQEEYIPESKAKEYEYKSPFNNQPLVRKSEKNYFFKLSDYAEPLLRLMTEQPDFVQPTVRRNEVINRIREGLNDVPISRTGGTDWGIKVPGDETHTIYVWIDALFNYLSTIDTDDRCRYWPADVHFIAKDILWFHAVIWPAMLMALKRELPRQVYAHGFWIAEGQKMSKSLGNFIDLEKIDHYVNAYGIDALRYFLASNGPLGANDSDFADATFVEVYNADLANDLGNLVQRTLSMIQRYRDGAVAQGSATSTSDATDTDLVSVATRAVTVYAERLERLGLHEALTAVWELVTRANRYVEENAPWKLAKDQTQAERLDAVLYHLAESVRLISVLIQPVMPDISSRIRVQLGLGDDLPTIDELAWGKLPATIQIQKPTPLFPKHES